MTVEEKVEGLVQHYVDHRAVFERLGEALFNLAQDAKLRPLIHSSKWRSKDPAHLAEKLRKKIFRANEEGVPFEISSDNLFEKINDLSGLRLIYLHTDQFPEIDVCLRSLLDSEGYTIIEGPKARVWDSEYESVFKGFGVETDVNPRLYSSVHYVVSATGKLPRTAEIQVRTLAEEVWGEVDHLINYPDKSELLAITEQIRVLARVTSSCTRLVDSIFRCHKE